MCNVAGVSRSGYYTHIQQTESKQLREYQDEEDFEWINKAFHYRRKNKGARQIKMVLENDFGKVMNLKKIRRLMKKFHLICPIRKANPYRRMAKAMRTSSVAPNKLERRFEEGNPNQIFLTDITYLRYDLNKWAYLSAIKDGVTKEIHAHTVSKSLDVSFVEDTMKQMELVERDPNAMINSDQGCHYTSTTFIKAVKDLKMEQSMSRRGNCWDNAPIESFFGHMKDEINLIDCKTFEDVVAEIDDYIDYYNNHRYQWKLKRMTPKAYGDMLRRKNKKDEAPKHETLSVAHLI